ncbi:hypothetical protein EJ03DRAFT_347131 [Teratosphaeria nubilosa]|uniref:DRBM domain-containing protein n=1 Tax=Teratosphaeria nubilosa TaxID=161662 RepID=A0A6G1LNZ0_9PEZI|nr:hypothetical protein EJ03DRAFT_347131 [Teratosphaeria nubilosa]
MAPHSAPSQSPTASPQQGTPRQDQLIEFCRENNWRSPSYQVLSDRRGGRTAWSCEVVVGQQTIRARYWYDGQYVANAREDAAEVALQLYGVLPAPPGPQPTHYHQQQRQFWGGAGTVGS